MVTLKLQRYFVIYKRSPLKMQKIKKPRSPSRQLLETVNFAFMKIFDFLVKIAIFRASLLFLRFMVVIELMIREEMHDANLPKKRRNALKMVILTKKSKIFIKAKLTVSKSYLLGLVYLMISCIIRDAHL